VDDIVTQMVESMRLYCRYDWAVRHLPHLATTLAPLRDTHLAHAVCLADAAAGNTVDDPEALLATLAEAERSAQDAAFAACLAAAPHDAALLGEIAAARAAHGVVLAEAQS
jgi:hypothetical protein